MATIDEIADRAADHIEQYGHAKNDWGHPGKPSCIGGAISHTILAIDVEQRPEYCFAQITNAVGDMIGQPDFVDWNNAPERKPEEVIQVLRDVATRHRSDEMRSGK